MCTKLKKAVKSALDVLIVARATVDVAATKINKKEAVAIYSLFC